MKNYQRNRIIMGIDPGTNVMGYGLIKVENNIASFVTMGTLNMKKLDDPYLKLKSIFDFVIQKIEQYLPDELCPSLSLVTVCDSNSILSNISILSPS